MQEVLKVETQKLWEPPEFRNPCLVLESHVVLK